MAKKRYINTKYWADTFVVEKLQPLDRYLFLYFLTNEHTSICGVYELPMRTIIFETSLEEKTTSKILEKLDGKVYFKNGWVYVKNFVRHQVVNNSVLEGIKRKVGELPQEIVEWIQSVNRVGTDCDILNVILHNITLHNITYNVTPKSRELAELLFVLIKKENPHWYVDPNFNQWADDIEKIHRIDERTYEQIEWMIKWAQKDSFWSKNILSPSKLRKQFNKLVIRAKNDPKARQINFS